MKVKRIIGMGKQSYLQYLLKRNTLIEKLKHNYLYKKRFDLYKAKIIDGKVNNFPLENKEVIINDK